MKRARTRLSFRWALIFRNRYTYWYAGIPVLLSVVLMGGECQSTLGSKIENCACLPLADVQLSDLTRKGEFALTVNEKLRSDEFPAGSKRSHRCFYRCTFDNIQFTSVDLSVSRFDSCTFLSCEFTDCDFRNTDITSTTRMWECRWIRCNLSNAAFSQRLDTFAKFTQCNFHSCSFSPSGLDTLTLDWIDNANLFYLQSVTDTNRWKAFKNKLAADPTLESALQAVEAGEKRRVTHRLSAFDWLKDYVIMGNFLNDFRTNHLKPLIPMVLMIPLFFIIYLRSSYFNAIFISWTPSLRGTSGKDKYTAPLTRLVGKNNRRRAAVVFYFTLVSALGFGYFSSWINLQSLIAALQKRDFSYKLEGNVKAWSIVQALIFLGCIGAEIASW